MKNKITNMLSALVTGVRVISVGFAKLDKVLSDLVAYLKDCK